MKSDHQIVLAAVKQDWGALQYAAEEMKSDHQIVLAVVKQNWRALQYAAEEMKSDHQIVLAAVQQDVDALEYAAKEMKSDHQIVLAAVQQDGDALEYAAEEMKSDHQIVLAAVQQNWRSLEYAAEEMKQKEEILVRAFESIEIEHLGRFFERFFSFDALLPVSLLCKEYFTDVLCSEPNATVIHTWVDNPRMAERLKQLVKADERIAYLKDKNGKLSIDRANPECQQAMLSALRLFDVFEVDKNSPLLHTSRTSVVFRAIHFQEKDNNKGVPRALKCMGDLKQVIAELKGRNNMNLKLIVQLMAIYVDESLEEELKQVKKNLPNMLDDNCANVKVIPGLQRSISKMIWQKRLKTNPQERLSCYRNDEDYDCNQYSYVLVFECGDRTLEDAIQQDRIIGGSEVAKHILRGIANACTDLHEMKRIHGDLKPRNIVLVGTTPKLIDLDISCEIGSPYGTKAPSTGFCAPEVAIAYDNRDHLVGSIEPVGSIEHDLFSLGVIMFRIEAGRQLWNIDRDDNVAEDDARILLNWRNLSRLRSKLRSINCSEEARDLMGKLLEPNPEKRIGNFTDDKLGRMEMVLKDPYFNPNAKLCKQIEKTHELIKTLSLNQKKELETMKGVFLRGIYEANEVTVPTTFVILEQRLLDISDKETALLEVELQDDGSRFKFKGKVPEGIRKGHAILQDINAVVNQICTWTKNLTDSNFDDGSDSDGQKKLFEVVKGRMSNLVKKKMYFYPVDELTGKPVEGNGYPIPITTPSKFVGQVYPFISIGMKALSLYTGTAGIARMFGLPVPLLPKSVRDQLKDSVSILKQRSSVEEHGIVQDNIDGSDVGKNSNQARGAPLRELKEFYKQYDKKNSFAGLRRIAANDGGAIWTILEDDEVANYLDKRTQLRELENQKLEIHKQQVELQSELENQKTENEKLHQKIKMQQDIIDKIPVEKQHGENREHQPIISNQKTEIEQLHQKIKMQQDIIDKIPVGKQHGGNGEHQPIVSNQRLENEMIDIKFQKQELEIEKHKLEIKELRFELKKVSQSISDANTTGCCGR